MDRLLKVSRAALAIAAGLAIVACDRTDSPTSVSTAGNGTPETAPLLLQSPPPVSVAAKNDSTATKRIGLSGGTIQLTNIIKVKFPRGAVASDTDVTIRLLDRERVLFSVTPENLQLQSPVEITVDHLDGTDSRRFPGLSIYRSSGSSWVQLPSGRRDNKMEGTSDALGDFAVARNAGSLAKGADDPATIEMLRWLSGPSFETVLIEAAKGGEVKLDRFKVKLPKNALATDTYITVRDPGTGYLMCELEPHGIQFLAPVALEMNVEGLTIGDYTDWTIFWLNEETGHWEDESASYSLSGHTLTADLMHFSRYAGGRAGW